MTEFSPINGAWFTRTNSLRLNLQIPLHPLPPDLTDDQRHAALTKIARKQDLEREKWTLETWRDQIRSLKD